MTDEAPRPFVVVTNKEVYDVVMETRDEVVELKSLLVRETDEKVELKKRVRSLELKFYGILAGLIVAVGGYLSGALPKGSG